MEPKDIILIGEKYYRLCYRDNGFTHKEDKGLWRALHVEPENGDWGIHDDDDYIITDDGRVIATEVGWGLKREPVRKIYNREWENITKGERHILLIEEYLTADGIATKKINETINMLDN